MENNKIVCSNALKDFMEAGLSLAEIEKKHGIEHRKMSAYLKSMGINPTQNRVKSKIKGNAAKEILNMFINGETIKSIAMKTEHERATIRRVLIREMGNKEDIPKTARKNWLSKMSKNRIILPPDLLKRYYDEGLTAHKIHQRIKQDGYDVSYSTLIKNLHYNGLDPEKNYTRYLSEHWKLNRDRIIKMIKLFENGHNMNEIHKKTKLSTSTISIYLHKAGISTNRYYYTIKRKNKEELIAEKHMKKSGYAIFRCGFLCWRKSKLKITLPNELKHICNNCRIKNIEPEGTCFFDFVAFKGNKTFLVEVKSEKNGREPQFTFGQAVMMAKAVKQGISIKVIHFHKGEMHETDI